MISLLKNEFVANSLVAFACLVLLLFFPASTVAQQLTSAATFLFLLPYAYIRLILGKKLSDFGVSSGNVTWQSGLILALSALVFSLFIVYLLLTETAVLKNYSLPEIVRLNFWAFALYESLIVGFFTALYEFFFRGFLLFSWNQTIGRFAWTIQFLTVAVFFSASGSDISADIFFLIVAFFSGLIVSKCRSLLYSFAYTMLFVLLSDALVIKFTN